MSADLGYFGPDSVTWRIHSEPVALIGGLRALLLQALHPQAMTTLAATSDYQQAPWGRLQRTGLYVATLAFAPTAEVDRVAARVRGIHSRLGIDDPEQLTWVHACEIDSFLTSVRRAGVAISAADADRYIAEQLIAASLVGIPDGLAPATSEQLHDYFQQMRTKLALTPQAQAAARTVLLPPLPIPLPLQLPARMGWSTVAAMAVGLLPGWAARLYRLPPLPGRVAVNAASLRALRVGTMGLPVQLRQSPLYRAALTRARNAA